MTEVRIISQLTNPDNPKYYPIIPLTGFQITPLKTDLTLMIMNWRKVSFRNSRRQTLSGMLLAKAPSGPSPAQSRPFLIVCHGFTGSKEGGGRALEMAEQFSSSLAINCLLFDFCGNGESEGKFQEITLSRQIQDLQGAIAYCRNQGAEKILTMGRSFGAATALAHAATSGGVAGVCLWACPADPHALFQSFIGPGQKNAQTKLLTLKDNSGQIQIHRDFFTDLKKYNLLALVKTISPNPLLLLHGLDDDLVSPKDSERLYDQANEPKKLHLLPGTDHRFQKNYKAAWDICCNWLKQLLS